MGILADAALAAGGEVIGIIPRRMIARELGHAGVTSLIPVDSMHERKQKMADLADAFLALPGGIGTMEELFEAFTWLQLGLHHKPVGLLNVAGFYDRLLEFLAHMRGQRFLKPQHFARCWWRTMWSACSTALPGSIISPLANGLIERRRQVALAVPGEPGLFRERPELNAKL